MDETDWELIERCRNDDQDAWSALYKRHAGCLYQLSIKIARRKHGDPDECLSHAHEAFIRCVRRFDPDRGVKFVTLLWRSANNACTRYDPGGAIYIPCNAFRVQKTGAVAAMATVQHSIDDRTAGIQLDDIFRYSDDPSVAMENKEQIQLAKSRFSKLPARDRDVLRRRSNGETLKEIAESYGICKERVRQIESRARHRLANMDT